MQEQSERFAWGALVLGVLLGLIGGLAYAWFVNPVKWVNISPDRLGAEDQREYIRLVADSYLQDGDLDRAEERLSWLGVRDVANLVSVQADSALLSGADPNEVRALAALAEALGQRPMAAEVFAGTIYPSVSAGSGTATATFEGMPTLTPSPRPGSVTATPTPFTPTPTPVLLPANTEMSLSDREIVCSDSYPEALIEVYVYNSAGRGVPGIEIQVTWADGQDTFFTGMKPEIDPGYADFEMEPDTEYTITLVGLGEPVVGIQSNVCQTPSGRTSIPTYQLTFEPR